jgi:glutathionylspermidine synthase
MPIEVRPIAAGDALSEPTLARELAQRYLIFDAYVAGARRVEVQPLVLPLAMHESAVRAAESVVATVGGVAARAHTDPAERARYGLSDEVIRLAAASYDAGDDAALMRVDLLLGEDGQWRACEINADCPGGHNESVGLPKLARAAGFMAGRNPTMMLENLTARLASMARANEAGEGGGAVGLVFATAYAEDLQVCAIVQRMLEQAGTRALLVPPTAPRYDSGALRVAAEPVSVLYRYFPAEYMEGQRNLDGIVQAIRDRRVRTLSSFSHIYTQSKYAFARAWAHHASLDAADRAVVEKHVPQSSDLAAVPRDRLIHEREQWVIKRAYGRVGDEVFVGPLFSNGDWASLVDDVRAMRSAGQSWIAQRFVRQRPIPTPWGDRYVTLGAYVLDGRFVGYFARITPDSHVSHDALCVPVFTEAA